MSIYNHYLNAGDILPVFPLPEYVLFPDVTAPLHIFEPRYRQMMEDVLDSRGVFCMATMRNPSSKPQLKIPPFWGLGCVCRLADYDQLPDGRYAILVEGLVRARLREVPSQRLYRRVRVTPEPLAEAPAVSMEQDRRVRRLMERVIAATADAPEGLAGTLQGIGLEPLLNLMAFHCPVQADSKLKLLYATSVLQLCERVTELYDASS